MKKLLALVLALVMTMGLATISSNAAFPDAADVSLNEAVDVMSAVGVFKGNDAGNFDPDGESRPSERGEADRLPRPRREDG